MWLLQLLAEESVEWTLDMLPPPDLEGTRGGGFGLTEEVTEEAETRDLDGGDFSG